MVLPDLAETLKAHGQGITGDRIGAKDRNPAMPQIEQRFSDDPAHFTVIDGDGGSPGK